MARQELKAGDYRISLTPELGGSISRFDWRGQPLFRPTRGPAIFDSACFPLVPFSNRIAFGRFQVGETIVQLEPNFPKSDHPHTLHGFGWQASWSVEEAAPNYVRIRHEYRAGAWPWAYAAEQGFYLSETGFRHALRLRNLSDSLMPAGLGFHPYFVRNRHTVCEILHRGEWTTAEDGLPVSLRRAPKPVDWWHGQSVEKRCVDTVYTERQGAISLTWPDHGMNLRIEPCDLLSCTTIYSPAGQNFFCAEPVSHSTNAINFRSADSGLRWLAPGEDMQVHATYQARKIA